MALVGVGRVRGVVEGLSTKEKRKRTHGQVIAGVGVGINGAGKINKISNKENNAIQQCKGVLEGFL